MAFISPIFANISSGIDKYKWKTAFAYPQNNNDSQPLNFPEALPWIKEKSIYMALNELKSLEFNPKDISYLKNMGVNLPFKSGKEAVDYIAKQNIRILYEPTSESGVHAQYDFYKNLIIINQKYKNTDDFPVILAIAEAILHETGHAKDNDAYSSIQEELDFLGMNAIAHRAFLKKYGDLFSDAKEPIIKDGVRLYAKLFFDPDPNKMALVNRISEKYGDLPSGDNVHPPGELARKIKKQTNISTSNCNAL